MTVIAGALFASSALAQPALPFKAYGSGLKAGQVVTATKGTTEVARATVDANGNWTMDIPADKANPGDAIGFTLDGQRANQTITFQNGQFVPPPGLALTVAAGGGEGLEEVRVGRAVGQGDVAEHPRHLVLALPRDQLEGRWIGDRDHVGFLNAREPLDR